MVFAAVMIGRQRRDRPINQDVLFRRGPGHGDAIVVMLMGVRHAVMRVGVLVDLGCVLDDRVPLLHGERDRCEHRGDGYAREPAPK